jgi:hypothetical protein
VVAVEARGTYPAPVRSAWSRRAAVLAIALGGVVRLARGIGSGFPLNDGGMFLTMVRDLQRAHYILPRTTSYNGGTIPFAYPPLGFYIVGLLNAATHIGLLTLFQVLPPVLSAGTVYAFFRFARRLLPSEWMVVAAVLAYALLPRSFIWLVMGGGLTRALGVLFGLLALERVHAACSEQGRRHVVLGALFIGLTALSHLEAIGFVVSGSLLLLIVYGRSERGVLAIAAIACGALLVVAPWLLAVVSVHGLGPLTDAKRTGLNVLSDASTRRYLLLIIARFGLGTTQEQLFPVLAVLGALGALRCLCTRRPLLPAFWAVLVLTDARAFETYVAVPLAMMAGVGVCEVLWPALRSALPSPRESDTLGRDIGLAQSWMPSLISWQSLRARWAIVVTFAFLLCYAGLDALIPPARATTELAWLTSLPGDQQAAMRWISANTPADSRFVVVTDSPGGWAADKTAEWFPALTGRVSVATVQGTEWLPNYTFDRTIRAYNGVQSCAGASSACLDAWMRRYQRPFATVFLPDTTQGESCCARLAASLRADPRYMLIYDGPGGLVFERASTD